MTTPPPASTLYRVPATQQRLVTTSTGIRIGCAYTPPPAPCHEPEPDWGSITAWAVGVALPLLILVVFLIFWS